jgi:hypothetical protein
LLNRRRHHRHHHLHQPIYIHEKPPNFIKRKLTTIFPLAFVAAALEDLPAGAKVN